MSINTGQALFCLVVGVMIGCTLVLISTTEKSCTYPEIVSMNCSMNKNGYWMCTSLSFDENGTYSSTILYNENNKPANQCMVIRSIKYEISSRNIDISEDKKQAEAQYP